MLDVAPEQALAFARQNALSCGVLFAFVALAVVFRQSLAVYGKFAYACFLKPLDHGNASDVRSLSGQQRALEGFYRTQASIYDSTRGTLLSGREDMLQLAAAQLKHRYRNASTKPIWVDVSISLAIVAIRRPQHTSLRSVAVPATTSRK